MTRRVVTAGLAPSGTLAPSSSLAPADTIYGGAPITPHAIWMATSPTGLLENQSAYVEFGEGVTYSYGRATEFDDAAPGTFTFTLNNIDGRFTPDNPASPLGTRVAEGMYVEWLLGTRVIVGRVLTLAIPPSEDKWNHLVVTCDDMLGTAGRHAIKSLPDAILEYAKPKALWKLDDASTATMGVETYGDPLGPFQLTRSNPTSTTQAVTFGVQQTPGLPGTAMTLTAAPGETNWFGTRHGNQNVISNIGSPIPGTGVAGQQIELGYWGMWVYPGSTINLAVVPSFGTDDPRYAWSAQIQCTPSTYAVKGGTRTATVYTLTAAQQVTPHYLEMGFTLIWQASTSYWALALPLFVDGTKVAQNFWYDPKYQYVVPTRLNAFSPVDVSVSVTTPAGATANLSGTVQRVAFKSTGGGVESLALSPTLDGRRQAIDLIADDVNTLVYNGPLSTAVTGFPDTAGTTVLDALNDIVRSESGHLFASSPGVVGNTGQYIEVRARDRPAAVSAAYDVALELDGLPTFVRDLTNVAAALDVAGPDQTLTVTDPTIMGRYVAAGVSETVLYAQTEDLREWGQDRLNRGKNRAVRAQQFTVDAASTPTDRSVDLLKVVPGDRLQLTGLPLSRLGFTTWDGWLEGGSESHTAISNRFTYTLTPTLPTTAVYDTAVYASGGDIRLGNTYTATATSIVFNVQNSYTIPSTAFPYTILIDNEQMTVTAVSGSTWTVTRGVNGTTAASHTVNAFVEMLPTALYAY